MHAETSYLFRHAIVRNGAYSLQLPAHRQELHALAVDCFEHCFGEDDIKQYCGQLAGHARLGELPAASETHFLVQAAELASATYQNNDAASYLFRLVELHPDNAKFRMQLGVALFDIGQMAVSKRELHTAIKLADVDLIAECRVALAITLTSLGDIDTARTELETLLLAATGELRLRALGNLANLLALTGQLEQAEVAYREIIEDSGTQRMTAMAQTALANVLTELGKPEEAGQLGEAALAIARQVDDPRLLLPCTLNMCARSNEEGRYDEALKYAREGEALALKLGDKRHQGAALFMMGEQYVLLREYGLSNLVVCSVQMLSEPLA